MAQTTKPKVTYLKDYKPSHFLVESVFLHFDLDPKATIVKAIIKFYRNPESKDDSHTLMLNGEELQLKRLLLDGKEVSADRYTVQEEGLTLFDVPDHFTLETEVMISPSTNTELSGLYQTKEDYCTQCEPQGFRRITYFLDRPDVLTRFTTTIAADKKRYPVLLSNGNLIDEKDLDHGRHWVKWEDPSLKPCYLFALVASNYEYLKDKFTTSSGREVELRLYVEKGKLAQTHQAMLSLKKAMRWDEINYGREYDLDIYMVVAVSDFNMGAMENKGLNIFNDKYILAKPDIATDDDYVAIESVIGHEYFHNWTGNRVTIRNWFQITLKEGLTIFRDQSFTADMTSKAVKRIKDVNIIRNAQFPQDAGPMAHPIRPDSYIEINNFYTVTVYNKGAEVIRMVQTLLGHDRFRQAMDLYFERYDGKAITTEDFIRTMQDSSDVDLTQFYHWYTQAGTPVVEVSDEYDAVTKTYRLHMKQSCPPTPDQPVKKEFHIPIVVGLLDENGDDIKLHLKGEEKSIGTSCVLNLKEKNQTFEFIDVEKKPLPSLLRNFSAPVKLNFPYTDEQLVFLMSHDGDGFNAADAGQQLAVRLILKLVKDYQNHREMKVPENFISSFQVILKNVEKDRLLAAEKLILPSESYLIDLMDVADVDGIYYSRLFVRKALALKLESEFLERYNDSSMLTDRYLVDVHAMGLRKIKNLSLSYLMLLEKPELLRICVEQFHKSTNMTDVMGALISINHIDCRERDEALIEFYEKWQNETLVVDKWFTIQAISPLPNTLAKVKFLMLHPAFDIKNPNKVRALVGAFCSTNYLRFHDNSGDGYEFLADQVLKIDAFNPQLAARIIEPLIRWRKFDKHRQDLMRAQLERIAAAKKLSNDVYEIVSKSLAY